MTVSLVAVFIPVLFMGGVVGRLLHEFAVTIAAAILISGFVSISLTPMLCSRFLRPPHDQRHGWLYNAFERIFDAWRRVYGVTLSGVSAVPPGDDGGVDRAARRSRSICSSTVPKGFLPNEDQGRFNINTEGAQGIASTTWCDTSCRSPSSSMTEPNIASIGVNVGLVGNNATGGSNTGRMFVELKPRERARRARWTR